MRNILLIGGAGFIGSNVIRYMLRLPDQYRIFVMEPVFANVSRIETFDINIYRGELSDIDSVQSVIEINKIDTIVHLVSTLIPGSTFDDYKREFQNVIFPSIELMSLCAKRNIKFIYFSSGGTIYGNSTDKRPFKESDTLAPISYYGWSKQMMENGIQYVHRTEGLQYLIVRPSNPYGHGQRIHAKQGLIAVSLGKIFAGEPITVWGDGCSVRDYIYIDDLARIMQQLIEKDVSNITLNVGSGVGTSVNDIMVELKNITEEYFDVNYVSSRKVDVANMILDTTELHQYFDLNFTSLHDGITKFYSEIKNDYGKS